MWCFLEIKKKISNAKAVPVSHNKSINSVFVFT